VQALSGASTYLELFNLGGGEILLILALILVLFGAKHLPLLARGLGRGIREFLQATKDVTKEIHDGAHDAGRSLGGIYGKRATQAITPDNHVSELYDPAVFGPKSRQGSNFMRIVRLSIRLWLRMLRDLRSRLGR
jgi:TatA/E family protein of Tat protein translocase